MPMFDERSPKYRHFCCHIRVSAYVIGILELLSVLYILAQHSVRSIIADVQHSDSDNKHTHSDGSSATQRWLGPGATTPLVTWAVSETLFLGLMFYGIARARPWLLIPQLFLQIVTIVVCMILNILMVYVLAWHPYVNDIWYFLVSTVIFAFLYEYGLVVLVRCYRYLRDKVSHESQTAHGVYVLPTGANGELIITASDAAIMESRMYSDLPPEYAIAISMMTVDEASKPVVTIPPSAAPVPSLSTETKTETASDSSCLRHKSEDEQESKDAVHHSDDNAPPPTYEEARQLQNARSSSASTH